MGLPVVFGGVDRRNACAPRKDRTQLKTAVMDAHPVDIWNNSGTLLRKTTVPSGTTGTLVGGYHYTSVAPLTLIAGQTYVIGTYFGPVVNRCGTASVDI
jgi:hypothetical protein